MEWISFYEVISRYHARRDGDVIELANNNGDITPRVPVDFLDLGG